jgi:hypothetical protein
VKHIRILHDIPNQWRSKIVAGLKLLLGSVLILMLIVSGQLDFSVFSKAFHKLPVFFAGFLCCTAAFIIPVFRWWILSRIQLISIGISEALRLTMIGYFFNTFMPSSSGGDIVRAAYAMHYYPTRKTHVLTIAFADRLLGIHALLLVSTVFLGLNSNLLSHEPALWLWLIFMVVLLIVGITGPILFVWPRTSGFIIRLCGRAVGGANAWQEVVLLYHRQPVMLVLSYLCSIGNVVCNVVLIHFMMVTCGSSPKIGESLAVVPLIILANALPITPGGIGVAEAASAGFYNLIGQTGGANGMLLARFVIIMHSMAGLPFFLFNKKHPVTPENQHSIGSS